MTFGDIIKNARKKKGLTQKELAEMINAKHNSISDWEKNKSKPDVDTIELLCGVLGISPSLLFKPNLEDSEIQYANEGIKQAKLIKKYNLLNEGHQQVVLDLIESLITYEEKYNSIR